MKHPILLRPDVSHLMIEFRQIHWRSIETHEHPTTTKLRQHYLKCKFITPKAILLGVLFCWANSLYGQNQFYYSAINSEYDFSNSTGGLYTSNSQVWDGNSYGNNWTSNSNCFGGDPTPVLTMDYLAANGDGQWTLSSSAGQGLDGSISGSSLYPSGWFLLGNGFGIPSLSYSSSDNSEHPGCFPPGVVSNGQLNSVSLPPTEPKATANLDGTVNFVWPDRSATPSGSQFIIQNLGPGDVDISLTGIPNPAISRQIVKNSIHPFSASTITGSVNTHSVTTTSPFQDEFDICSDAHYLYIIWCSTDHSSPSGSKEIWIAVFNLSTSSLIGDPVSLGLGERPTIACDARNNRAGTPSPSYEYAYVTSPGTGGTIVWGFNHAGTTGYYAANNQFMNPTTGATSSFLYPMHVRALVSSILGSDGTSSWKSALYAIVYGENGNNLILYNPANLTTPHICPAGVAAYVDGIILNDGGTFGSTPSPTEVNTWQNPGYFSVRDNPIVAFANPYDNQTTWHEFDQYHCLYQIIGKDNFSNVYNPLLIVRNSDNGGVYPTSPDPSVPDTRLVIDQVGFAMHKSVILPDPEKYVAAINQMGIYVHWRSEYYDPIISQTHETHFYARDQNRTFDENVDENTLVTGECYASNGSGHGGTVGAEILGGKRMTVWSDPNYGYVDPPNVNRGLYQPPYYAGTSGAFAPGTINFHVPPGMTSLSDANVKLIVGDGESPATLAVMPYFQFLFDNDVSGTYSSQSVTVNGGSTFDYYGLCHTTNPTGGVSLVTEIATQASAGGALDGYGGGNITLAGSAGIPANLIVHAGADFHLMEASKFTSGSSSAYGNIDIRDEANIDPYNSATYLTASGGTQNGAISGVCTFEGIASLENSIITGHFPPYVWSGSPAQNYAIHVLAPSNAATPLSSTQYSSSNNTYLNNSGSSSVGLSEIRFDGNFTTLGGSAVGYGNVSFDNDVLNSNEITAINPQNSFSVTNSTFAGTSEKAISIVHNFLTSAGTYGNMNIANNTFNDATSTAIDDVYFNGFNIQAISHVTVSDNAFNAGFHDADQAFTAIDFESTDGAITNNTIKGGFLRGIIDIGPFSSAYDGTFICSNIVTKSTSYSPAWCIYTQYYDGYVKLNDLSYAGNYGYWHSLGGPPHLIANNIYNNLGTGILVGGTIDLSGVHHGGYSGGIWSIDNPGTGDIGAYNSIYNNSSSTSPDDGQIYFTSSTIDIYLTQTLTSLWTAAGENNVYSGSSSTSTLVKGPNNHSLDVSNNWWGSGMIPAGPGGVAPWPSFGYSLDGGSPFPNQLSAASSSSGISCGSGYLTDDKHEKGLLQIAAHDSCWGLNDNCEYYTSQRLYDSAFKIISYYIMHCYGQADPSRTLASDLSSAGGSTQLSTEAGRLQYRKWILDTVLELRSDDGWFCYGVQALAASYNEYGPNYPAALAIEKFLIENPRCSAYRNDFGSGYDVTRRDQIAVWGDTAKNNNMKYFDSTLPSFHMLGLDTLLNFASVHHYDAEGPEILLDAHITSNPFEAQTSVSLTTAREAYLHIDVLDLLGRKLQGAGYDGVFEPGSRTIPLKMASLASGTYYVRISTANNELRTIKIVKQE